MELRNTWRSFDKVQQRDLEVRCIDAKVNKIRRGDEIEKTWRVVFS